MTEPVPVVLFTHARPRHLEQTLAALRENAVPLIYAFSDAARSDSERESVRQVRTLLRNSDWCDMRITERPWNLGLGQSIRSGVEAVFERHNALIVFEDDLVCVPGTYLYLCAALEHYADAPNVMSVTGWTNPAIVPPGVKERPYFDALAECWSWGAWRSSWKGMEQDAKSLMQACSERGIDVHRYGPDLPAMAETEMERNVWAVRWTYLHLLRGGLCLRPPRTMVENIGFDSEATNTNKGEHWQNTSLGTCPRIPEARDWPDPVENKACRKLWRRARKCEVEKRTLRWFLREMRGRYWRFMASRQAATAFRRKDGALDEQGTDR